MGDRPWKCKHSGICIPLEYVCDGEFDCGTDDEDKNDDSDEENCGYKANGIGGGYGSGSEDNVYGMGGGYGTGARGHAGDMEGVYGSGSGLERGGYGSGSLGSGNIPSVGAKKIQRGTLCSATGSKEITSANECKAAAEELGLVWAGSWNGPNDFPGCLHAEDGRNKVYFNTSPNPRRTNLNPKYAAICEVSRQPDPTKTASFFGCKGQKIALQVPTARHDTKFIMALPDRGRVNANGQSPKHRDARMIALESIYGKYVTAVRPSNDT